MDSSGEANLRLSRQVNVAVVGLGFMGMTHLKAYRQIESARIVAVCDAMRTPLMRESAAPNHANQADEIIELGSAVRAYRDLEEVLADPEVELVDLCVPTTLHHPQAIAALKAGKHVICEKPLARTAVLAREISNVATTAKGLFMPALCTRFWPEWAWLKRTVDNATYGKVLAARFRRVSAAPGWARDQYLDGKQSGGALLDLHIHESDFVRYLFGRPLSVYSSGVSRFSGAIDHVVTQYRVAGGASVIAEGSWLMPPGYGFNKSFTVNFERATVDYDLALGDNGLRIYEESHEPCLFRCAGPDGYVRELSHMIQAILAGTSPTVATVEDGVTAVEICEAEECSIRTHQVVALPPV